MRWRDLRRSSNVEDRRGMRGTVVGGGLGAVVIGLIALFLGVDPGVVLQGGGSAVEPSGAGPPPADDELSQFVAGVLGSTEDTWNALFREAGQDYREPTLVLFSGSVQSACGFAQSAMGPFYCPPDQKVYIDLSFFEDLRGMIGASGDPLDGNFGASDFAQAYVIAHEVGHHVQTLLGISGQVREMSRGAGQAEANALSVRQELQADCFAGVWGYHAREVLDPGDVREALQAASAIGDDRLQRESQGYVVPESFTHGSSEQRVRWFTRGFESGDVSACDTFSGTSF